MFLVPLQPRGLLLLHEAYGKYGLARNKRIFCSPSDTLNRLLHKTLNHASEFFHITHPDKVKTPTCVRYIVWNPPPFPFASLNTGCNSLGNVSK